MPEDNPVVARSVSWLAGRRRAEPARPAVRRSLFLYEKVRLKWKNWRAAGAPRRVLRWIKKGVPGLDSEGKRRFRLIIDLRPLNLHMKEFKTRFETLSRLGSVIEDGEIVAFV